MVTGCVALPGSAGVGGVAGGRLVVVAQHACHDRRGRLEDELADGRGAGVCWHEAQLVEPQSHRLRLNGLPGPPPGDLCELGLTETQGPLRAPDDWILRQPLLVKGRGWSALPGPRKR